MTEEILSLSTIVERARINITSKKYPKGKLYELVGLADLGPYEYAVILARQEETGALIGSEEKLTAAQERKLEKALDDIVKLLLPGLEPVVLAALTTQQRTMIVMTWSAHVHAQAGAAEGNRPSRRTTAASSHGSKPSTAATRKRGSTRPRGL